MQRAPTRAIAAACATCLAALTACTTLAHHTAEPYASEPAAAAALEREAAAWCEAAGQPGGAPTRPFRFDGCSFWLDSFGGASWRACCQAHDYAYWCGGPAAARSAADAALGRCVAAETNAAYGALVRAGVRAGGHPLVPMYFRWGYGHAYSGCYDEPDAEAPAAPASGAAREPQSDAAVSAGSARP
jgi:hypothetical protein